MKVGTGDDRRARRKTGNRANRALRILRWAIHKFALHYLSAIGLEYIPKIIPGIQMMQVHRGKSCGRVPPIAQKLLRQELH